ncbi:hypothetical protein [uncultured Gemella sp.]|uniref:hypothetical protein n=1 Tax=uncultured Gemella sp. TaxID=254352 RepID=UPI0028D3C24D|nr:hypothetical protein [uncultured Gemella sp.]
MKKSIAIFSSIIVAILICATAYYFMFGGGKDNKVKEEYQKYVDMINIKHDFEGGSKGLDTLTTDVAQKVIPTIKTDIKVAKEIRNTAISLEDKKIDDAKDSLDRAKELDTNSNFSPAINWLSSDIDNYKRAEDEIKNLKTDSNFNKNLSQVLEKYKFNNNSLKQVLSDAGNKILEKAEETAKKEKELAEKREQERKKKRSDVDLGGPNPALLNDSNSLPADANGIGGAMDEEGARKMSSDLVNRYKGYLLKKYDGESIEWSINGKSFKIIKEDGSKLTFTTQAQLYKKVGNRLVSGVNLNSEEGSEFLYRT